MRRIITGWLDHSVVSESSETNYFGCVMTKLTVILLSVLSLIVVACSPGQPMTEKKPEEGVPAKTLPPNTVPTQTLASERSEQPPFGAQGEFRTDFSITSVPFDQIISGGPPKDGIPSIDNPRYETIQSADDWLDDAEPVIAVSVNEIARAYPIQVLMWHEIVNDTLADLPLVVTFCPLCNTAIGYQRQLDGRLLEFGTTGRLRFSNLIMYDRQTESWWQQATGEAIVGELTGEALAVHPVAMVAWSDFKSRCPQGDVLSRETGYQRPYGQNPYSGYDDINRPPLLYEGPATPGVLSPLARVLTVEINAQAVAYPYTELEVRGAINDVVGGEPIVVFWTSGAVSALDRPAVAGGRDVGAAVAYSRSLNEQTLDFTLQDGVITDLQTGSSWDIFGHAVDGELSGSALVQLPAVNHFWFSWAAFKPETRVFGQME